MCFDCCVRFAFPCQVFLSRPGQPGSEVTFGGQDLRRTQGPMAWVRLPRDADVSICSEETKSVYSVAETLNDVEVVMMFNAI